MASGWYNKGLAALMHGDFSLLSSGIKIMLLKTSYTYDPDHDFVNQLSEISATNYTGGFGGSGRKTLSVTVSEDDTNNRGKAVFSNVTWSALGGAVNDTVGAAVIFHEGTSDADSVLIAYFDLADTATNGSDFTLSMDASNGNLRINA